MDNIHSNWDDEEAVVMALELSDPNQPYSCSSWGGQFDNSEPMIVNGGSPYYQWWGMFEDTYVPANAFIELADNVVEQIKFRNENISPTQAVKITNMDGCST